MKRNFLKDIVFKIEKTFSHMHAYSQQRKLQ